MPTISLGDHEYAVVPQRIGYLQKHLGNALGGLGDPDKAAEVAGRNEITGPAYRLLRVFIPQLMPEHEFNGFSTPESFAHGERPDDAADRSPTAPEVADAFSTVFKVNRFDVAKHLGKAIPPELIQSLAKQAIGESISTLLLSSLSTSGESDSTTPSAPSRT